MKKSSKETPNSKNNNKLDKFKVLFDKSETKYEKILFNLIDVFKGIIVRNDKESDEVASNRKEELITNNSRINALMDATDFNEADCREKFEENKFLALLSYINEEDEKKKYYEAFAYYKEIFIAYEELTSIIINDRNEPHDYFYYTKSAHIISSYKFYRNNFNALSEKIKKEIDKDSMNDSYEAFIETLADSETKFSEIEDRFNKAEKSTITHMLTIMGVFTAVIAMVVSVAVTSSSWLSNASGASAIIAFVIPNLVIIIGILLLLSFITFIYREGKKRQIFSAIVFGVLIAFAIAFSSINIPKMITDVREGTVIHNRHILSENEFEIVKSTEEEPISFVFTFEFIEYTFEYDERLLHDGNLYFCEEHKTLE